MTTGRHFTVDEGIAFIERACLASGASPAAAHSLAAAIVSAETYGRASVGFRHLPDYLDGFRCGRINGMAKPLITNPAPALIKVDAQGGIAQLGFDRAFDALCKAAQENGIAAFAQRNSYTAGEIGYYARRLAKAGLLALAVSNGPPLLTPPGATRPVYCTNPLAFGAPSASGHEVVIDQAASQTAFVNVRQHAARGEPLPPGWALDGRGQPTTDAAAALSGSLTTFGGARGGNIALMVEILAAGLSEANWSLDAPSFAGGTETPGSGLFIVAVAAGHMAPDFKTRLDRQTERLTDFGVHVPGYDRAEAQARAEAEGFTIAADVIARIESFDR